MAEPKADLILELRRIPIMSSMMVVLIYIPTNSGLVYLLPAFSPAIIIFFHFWMIITPAETEPYCGFYLHFLAGW